MTPEELDDLATLIWAALRNSGVFRGDRAEHNTAIKAIAVIRQKLVEAEVE